MEHEILFFVIPAMYGHTCSRLNGGPLCLKCLPELIVAYGLRRCESSLTTFEAFEAFESHMAVYIVLFRLSYGCSD